MRPAATRIGPRSGPRSGQESGLAMVAVLLVLLALLVLCTPFLLTVRNADKASTHVTDRTAADLALDAAGRHARARLGASHPALDTTPYNDSLEEIELDNRFHEGFLDANDPQGVMWDLEASDLAGRIDLNSAPPQLFANLLGGAGRLARELDQTAISVSLVSTEGLAAPGFVWIDAELVGYQSIEGSDLLGLVRGLASREREDGSASACGPQPVQAHAIGRPVLEDRALAIPRWRIGQAGVFRTFDGVAQVAEAAGLTVAQTLGEGALATLERSATAHAGVRAGARWQRATRLVAPVLADGQGCQLQVEDLRWFNPGTTILITDGQHTELALVRAAENGIALFEPLEYGYGAFAAEVRPLARRPVNANTASPEVLQALFTNLQLRGASARVTASKAAQLAELVMASRPIDGLADFVRRVVLPAAGLEQLPADAEAAPEVLSAASAAGAAAERGFLSQEEALAVYKNAENANDNELGFSTLPLCFTSRDVYEVELRAAVNAASGAARVAAARELIELVVPQRDLLQVWARQEDFDEELRLDREAPGWLSGPEPTSRFDALYRSDPPARSRAHLGPYDSAPPSDPDAPGVLEAAFPSRETDGWTQCAPARTDEASRYRERGKVLHFDDESRDPEGRFLPDEPLSFLPADLGWLGYGDLLRPISFSFWIRPRALADGDRYFDLAGRFSDTDSIALFVEQGNLVLRVIDGAGDHPDTPFREVAEARYALGGSGPGSASGQGPGLPLDTWAHVEVDVRGNRPDQITLLVDGRQHGEMPGLTRLSAGLGASSSAIAVESTEGFPDRCVLRIGRELIEVERRGDSFDATFHPTGELAGFGGRFARERLNEGVNVALNDLSTGDYSAGTPVQLYGYAAPLRSNVPPAEASLPDEIGPFRAFHVTGIVKGGDKEGVTMEPILVTLPTFPVPISVGYGMDGTGDDVQGLILELPDELGQAASDEDMSAFSRSGGFAAILGLRDFTLNGILVEEDSSGTRFGGVEVVRYSGVDGNRLLLAERGGAGLAGLGGDPLVAGRGSFVFFWQNVTLGVGGDPVQNHLTYHAFVVPISIPGSDRFEPGQEGDSRFAQITRLGADSGLTEWVRYEEVSRGQLVRSSPSALLVARDAAHAGLSVIDIDYVPPGPGEPGEPGPGGPGGGGPGEVDNSFFASSAATAEPPAAPAQGQAVWRSIWGDEPPTDVVTRAVWSQFQFRGVLDTFSQRHPAGTRVLPVFRVRDLGQAGGLPGRFDAVMMMDADPDAPGFPASVHRAHRPTDHPVYTWQEDSSTPLEPIEGPVAATLTQRGFDTEVAWTALDAPARAPVAAGVQPGGGNGGGGVANDPTWESREIARLVLFPSGERPRGVQGVALGGSAAGAGARSGGGVPPALLDEAVLGFHELPGGGVDALAGAGFVLSAAISDGPEPIEVLQAPAAEDVDTEGGAPPEAGTWLATSYGVKSYGATNRLSSLPQAGGLLRIGSEILCYDVVDAASGIFHVPDAGRGLLGTEVQPHDAGEVLWLLEGLRVGFLGSGVGPDDSVLNLTSTADFPPLGTVRIEDELVHYTAIVGGALWMPRASEVPGAKDREGRGLFRGRYGTRPEAHAPGTPAILHPFRYWDRWAGPADAPELSYFELSAEQPNAFWHRVFFRAEDPLGGPGPRLGVLQRTDPTVPWDAIPGEVDGLQLLWDGMGANGLGTPLGVQTDRIEWRLFVEHPSGSFDALAGLSHAWKRVPRLALFGAEYMGPGMLLQRIER